MHYKSHSDCYFWLQGGCIRTRLESWDTLAMRWHLSSPVLYRTGSCFHIAMLLHSTKMAACSFFAVFPNGYILSSPFLKYKELIPVALALDMLEESWQYHLSFPANINIINSSLPIGLSRRAKYWVKPGTRLPSYSWRFVEEFFQIRDTWW